MLELKRMLRIILYKSMYHRRGPERQIVDCPTIIQLAKGYSHRSVFILLLAQCFKKGKILVHKLFYNRSNVNFLHLRNLIFKAHSVGDISHSRGKFGFYFCCPLVDPRVFWQWVCLLPIGPFQPIQCQNYNDLEDVC